MMRFLTRVSLIALIALTLLSSTTGATVRITFWSGFSGDDMVAMGELVRRFNAQQDEVFVDWVTYQWDQLNSKLILDTAAGRPPDVVALWATVLPEMVSKGILEDITDLVGEFGLRKEDYLPWAWNIGVFNDRRYSVPLDMHQLGLYVNTRHFADAGLAVPDRYVGAERFLSDAMKLTRDTNGDGRLDQYAVGILPTTAWPVRYWMALVVQQGGSILTPDLKRAAFNSQAGINAFQFLVDLIHRYRVSPDNLVDLNNGFLSGGISMIFNGPWMLNSAMRQAGLEFTTRPFPQIYLQRFAAWGQSHQLALPKQRDAARKAAAMKFIKFLLDNGMEWVKGGQTPARISVIQSPEFKKMTLWHPFVGGEGTVLNPLIIQQTKVFTHDPASPLVAAWEAIVQRRATVQDALRQAEARVNAILSEN